MLSTILFYLILTRSQYGGQYYSCFEISRDVDKLTWPIPKTLEAADVVFRIYHYLTPEILLITSSHCSSLYWFLNYISLLPSVLRSSDALVENQRGEWHLNTNQAFTEVVFCSLSVFFYTWSQNTCYVLWFQLSPLCW